MSTKEPAPRKPAARLTVLTVFPSPLRIGLILFIAGLVISLTLGGAPASG